MYNRSYSFWPYSKGENIRAQQAASGNAAQTAAFLSHDVGSKCALIMKDQIIYVELKSGFAGNGPAWIGKARRSRSGRTIYFNDQAFQSMNGTGLEGNYRNIESGDEYWISGIKKNQQDRNWSGSGAIMMDESIVQEYLSINGLSELRPGKFKVICFIEGDVIDRIQRLENKKIK